jgi:para-aminobenzoate synthetase/4-amino-4-deoxychorismate lyase
MEGNNSVILQDGNRTWLRFLNPVRIVTAWHSEDVLPALTTVESAVAKGLFAAGFIAYEAASGLDKVFRVHTQTALPLIWFGLYSGAERLTSLPSSTGIYAAGKWHPSLSESQYNSSIDRIRRYISAGDTYQVNYTIRLRATLEGSAYALFCSLVSAQQGRYSAFVDTDLHSICSVSPELFFRLEGDSIFSRPMKGTAPRGMTVEEDAINSRALQESSKNRAENVMIVDMIRNDLGRIADADSVQVTRMFDIERYPTVWQMTSTVEAKTHASFSEIVKAMFPCASITGAPKVRTMEIIHEVEPEPRGVYTGAIGYLVPNRRAMFNVAIRTVVVEKQTGSTEYGVGGGIVWDSVDKAEYEECLIKARILMDREPEFELIETILWTPGRGYLLKEKHLARILRSAEYFGFQASSEDMESDLSALADGLRDVQHKIRLLLSRDGSIRLEKNVLEDDSPRSSFRVGFASSPVSSRDRFLYHKTTYRRVYQEAKAARTDCDDVILYNERDEITESTIANIVVEIDGKRFTPPVECGLLAGVFREYLLEQGGVEQRIITRRDLHEASRIFLVNSVRQWMPAHLVQ